MAAEFACLAAEYWFGVFPDVCRQLALWRRRASAIPDPDLRRHALATHDQKRGHSEGAAAFAVLAPGARRPEVVRALVAFQAMYDYLDTVSEQPGSDPLTNGWRLHLALIAALDPISPQPDYYALNPQSDDGGYLRSLVHACRDVCAGLPSFDVVGPVARRSARRAMESQGYNHAVTKGMPTEEVARWSAGVGDDGLRWWEVVGASGSSLAILALIAAAAHPTLTASDRDAISAIYSPWAGALLASMDSLVDQDHDEAAGTHCLTLHYRSTAEAAERVGLMARRARELARAAPQSNRHALIIGAMVALFATEPEASLPDAAVPANRAIAELGSAVVPPLVLLRVRRRLGRLGRRGVA